MDDDEGEEKGRQTFYSRWRDAGKTVSEMARELSRGCARFGKSTDPVHMEVDKIYSTWIEVMCPVSSGNTRMISWAILGCFS